MYVIKNKITSLYISRSSKQHYYKYNKNISLAKTWSKVKYCENYLNFKSEFQVININDFEIIEIKI